eukprot:TRINITY_DN3939_c0_g1_i1.p1 TRINITY_DN3939_c0_g1~~TRINITY_DN3939_c0_g1_i1.p1  ORF type:complete len:718 (+),score=77.48 TRINITY_DN3939_c0_g1_i1:103-2256(+)
MIVSALLTSVGINLGLSILFFSLYSILRKQPGNVNVYVPRLVAEGKFRQQDEEFSLERLLPHPGWLSTAWHLSEDQLLATSGFDALVFMRLFIFSLRVFSFAGIVGIFILLPVNYFGDQLQDMDFSNVTNESLDRFSISNVKDGSKWLWVHFCAAYIFTGVVCYLLYYEFGYISSKRLAYFYSSKPQPSHFTILVRGIPASEGNSFNDTVENFFTEHHSSTYLSHSVVQRTGKLQGLIRDAEKLYKSLTQLKSIPHNRQKVQRDGFLGLFGRQVDIVDHYGKKLEDTEENVRKEQSVITSTKEELPVAFVCFKSRYGAAIAVHIQQSVNPTLLVTEQAPEPHDVYWPSFSASFMQIWISKLVVIVATIALTVLFLIPVVFVQGLTHLDQLEILFPFLKGILSITFMSQVITGYLPSLILMLFTSAVPPIMKLFSCMQGYISHSEIEKSACFKVLWFTIWNIFFANTLSGSVYSQISVFLDPKTIPARLAVAVPAQASFFIAYVVTSGWTSLSSELTRIVPLIRYYIGSCCSSSSDELQVPSIPYRSDIPKVLLFGLLGITYFFLAPLILPFLLAYYCLGYIVFRNQFLNVYSPKFETAGQFWPTVHNSTIFSLILMQLIAVGIFGLKKLPLASTLTVPLPVLTFLFNDYCRKRFLPIFQTYAMESLVKKDQEDLNDATMADFFDKLVTMYRHPAMLPVQYSGNADGLNSPLLTSAEA